MQGKVDAEAEPDLPEAWIRGEGTVERLFSDFEQDERDYYKKTKIFPIMHPIIIKTDILKNDPWVATSLFEAFTASRRAYDEFMQQPHRLSFAWGRSYLEEERKFFGKHPFYQGLKENHHDVPEHDNLRRPARDACPSLDGGGALHRKHEKYLTHHRCTVETKAMIQLT